MESNLPHPSLKLSFKEKRELRFKKICSNFDKVMLSPLICYQKINPKLFNSLLKAVTDYFNESKKYGLQNKTPNGLLVPKQEIEDQFNSVVIAYRNILLSLNFSKIISLWSLPVVRYKDALISPENKERPMRSELPHSDTWVGWDKNSILINIPILGDTDGNRVNYFNHPNDMDETWIQKQHSFEEGAKKFANKCTLIKPHYKKGYIYIADISVIHQTHRDAGCKDRVSVEIPMYIDYPKKEDFGLKDALSYNEIKSIGIDKKLKFPLKMGQIIGKTGAKRSIKFSLSN